MIFEGKGREGRGGALGPSVIVGRERVGVYRVVRLDMRKICPLGEGI